jgi:hypothetical protein
MISLSGYKTFQVCQRDWFYRYLMADSRVKKDPSRREVTLLSKMDSLQAWRGRLVDDILSKYLVLALNRKYPIDKDYLLKEALGAFDRRLEYAISQKYRDPGASFTNPDFAVLFDCELGSGLQDGEVLQARSDVISALTNVLDDRELMDYLKAAKHVISQRTLIYNFDRFSVTSKPDLIAFFEDRPPHIFDWKVHTFGTITYDEQLISYAAALYKVARAKPHVDFPIGLAEHSLYNYRLTEYQLLHPDRIRRDYIVTPEKVEGLGDKLSEIVMEMHMAGALKKYQEVEASRFPTTDYVEKCLRCAFQNICKSIQYEQV